MHAARLIPAEDGAGWDAALQGLPFASGHRRERAEVAARTLGARAALWFWEGGDGRAACAVLLREDALGRDLTTPLGFAGFACRGNIDGLAAAWTRGWREHGACAAYVQLAPGEAPPPGLEPQARSAQACWLWDLARDRQALLQGMAPKHRQLLRQWLRGEPDVAHDAEQCRQALAALYADFLRATPVAPAYRFDAADIARLAAMPDSVLVGVRGADGVIEAAMLLQARGDRGESLLAAATPAGRRHSRGLYWLGALELQRRGVRWLNLGGGIRGDDGLSQFKQRLGAARVPTLAIRQVIDPAAFEAACRRAGRPAAADGYFPPWREPG